MDLTLEEKASLCLGSDFWHTAPVPRAGIRAITLSDGPHGLRKQPDEGDHVGISGSVPATCFPTACALGSSFDPELVRRVGAAVGEEARAQGVDVVLGPGINIKRSPLCGRNFEYLSEDPLVAGVLGAALVEGLQSQGVGASVKHYAANNQETDRLRVSADVDERTLREIYLPGFERVVKEARPWTVMCAYNKVNGTYASEHHWLLTEVLRDEWGFDGLVMSDWGAVHDRVAAVAAGLDLEMPPNLGVSDAAIVAAVRAGELDEALLDQAVARVLQLVDRAPTRHRPRLRRGRPPRARPLDRRRVRGAAQEPRRAPAAGAGRRRHDRGDRRVRPHPALPGRRQLAGQPDPRRRRARRAARGGAGGRGGGVRRRRGRGRPARVPRDHRRRLPRPPRRRRVRGLRPHAHGPARRPARADPAARRGEPAARRRARQRLGRAALRLGAARRRRSSSAGSPARPPAAPPPTSCSARPTRRAGSRRRCRCGSRTTPPTSRSRARPATRSTARASSSATAATTPWRATSATSSATASPTRASTTTTCRRPSTATASTSPAASPTPASAAARRSPSSTSATPPPPSCVRRASSRASPRSTSSPARARR